jgi:hypothetical protein
MTEKVIRGMYIQTKSGATQPPKELVLGSVSLGGKAARTHFHLLARLRMRGAIPPLKTKAHSGL